jgi:hypothetical protein
MGNSKKSATDRFNTRINRIKKDAGKNDCWLWNDTNTYGLFRDDLGELVGAHRYSFEHHNNVTIPNGFVVIHLCSGNGGACVRPDHLSISTQKANQQHKVIQGRSSRFADRKPMTDSERFTVVMLHLSGCNPNRIARTLGRTAPHIRSLIRTFEKKDKAQLITTLEQAIVQLDKAS